MSKLTNNQISDALKNEGNIDVPSDARSKFSFGIKESIDDIYESIRNGAKEGDWELRKGDSDNTLRLCDPNFWSEAIVKRHDEGLSISTALSGYEYSITQKEGGGCTVEFDGPVNALLMQNLLPSMTYEPETLAGKFYDEKTGLDITPYIPINEYGKLRAEKNKGHQNMQDGASAWVNGAFNNEMDFLPKWRHAKKEHSAEKDVPQQAFNTAMLKKKDRVD